MDEKYKNIKIVGFDLDQTLYPKSELIDNAIQEYIYDEIAQLKNCSIEEAKDLFNYYYPSLSGSQTLVKIGFKKDIAKNIVQQALENAQITQFLEKDEEIINLINDIKYKYREVCLITGSNKKTAKEKLRKLGLNFFDYEIFADTLGCSKSDGTSYQKWLDDFKKKDPKLKNHNFLYIGDRSSTDVVIPHRYGIKAILVNVKKKDLSLKVDQLDSLHKLRELLF